ncbi:hypothetical protein [Aeromonas veronii]|uniref:hypothetical protein n=1 Tax=Aeromonas veronii TaxID=654 RepID=UPI001F25FC38|nr:hypothetical protein [Aeromonas veronii]
MATDKTKLEYERLAKHFYIRLERKNIKVTAKSISDELLACAPEYRPDYWRRLRGALVYHQKIWVMSRPLSALWDYVIQSRLKVAILQLRKSRTGLRASILLTKPR